VIERDKSELTYFMATIRYPEIRISQSGRDHFYVPFYFSAVSVCTSVCPSLNII
jgi:hypothetical protein